MVPEGPASSGGRNLHLRRLDRTEETWSLETPSLLSRAWSALNVASRSRKLRSGTLIPGNALLAGFPFVGDSHPVPYLLMGQPRYRLPPAASFGGTSSRRLLDPFTPERKVTVSCQTMSEPLPGGSAKHNVLLELLREGALSSSSPLIRFRRIRGRLSGGLPERRSEPGCSACDEDSLFSRTAVSVARAGPVNQNHIEEIGGLRLAG